MAEAADAAAAVASLAAAAVGAPSFKDAIATLQAHAVTHPALGARPTPAQRLGLGFATAVLIVSGAPHAPRAPRRSCHAGGAASRRAGCAARQGGRRRRQVRSARRRRHTLSHLTRLPAAAARPRRLWTWRPPPARCPTWCAWRREADSTWCCFPTRLLSSAKASPRSSCPSRTCSTCWCAHAPHRAALSRHRALAASSRVARRR